METALAPYEKGVKLQGEKAPNDKKQELCREVPTPTS